VCAGNVTFKAWVNASVKVCAGYVLLGALHYTVHHTVPCSDSPICFRGLGDAPCIATSGRCLQSVAAATFLVSEPLSDVCKLCGTGTYLVHMRSSLSAMV
jgi:hypothetical protein